MSAPMERLRRFGPGAIRTPANVITSLRLVLAIPALFLIVDMGSTWLTVGLWFVLSVTDGLDGWIARRDGTTRAGAFLDPLADKFLAVGGFSALAIRGDISWIPVIVIAGREVIISIYRSIEGRKGISLPARQLGKWKTFIQMAAIGFVLLPLTADLRWLWLSAIWAAVVLTVVSGIDVIAAARRPIRGENS
ncbi:MAG: CDP-alcohol phosphatidyltransferase family protein [Acidimicrobiia bacterium]|jgi:CDP-diacylglycerol---glycerol-3-phosphate 3-phosphatidyltransferase|nr:CDP-alcohol phosphatidyltransferase family protein [Acidimicrobiia bacterium]MBJ7512968.1 CDP-alcohol phosphatidyltransferase family protein [Acidimicrobiia bacterium]